MPEITSHPQGAPSWAELSTTDETGALSFYSALFEWKDNPQEMGPNWYYHMQTINDLPACSIYQQGEEERDQNVPPHWNIYFTVVSVEQTVEVVNQNGGSVVFGPMDVFEAGRRAMCQDPQGAFFAIWEPKLHIGCRVKFEPGAMCWNELLTTDPAAAIEFYQAALGMEPGEVIAPMNNYSMLKAGGTEVVGIAEITAEMPPMPPHWGVYFMVDDLHASVSKAESLGASAWIPSTDIIKEQGLPPWAVSLPCPILRALALASCRTYRKDDRHSAAKHAP